MAWCPTFVNLKSSAPAESIICAHFLSNPRDLWIKTGSNILLLIRRIQIRTGTSSIGNWLDFKPRGKLMYGLRERRKLPPKTCWITYGLQSLSTEKFLEVVQKILDGKYTLLKPPEVDTGDTETDEEYFLTEN